MPIYKVIPLLSTCEGRAENNELINYAVVQLKNDMYYSYHKHTTIYTRAIFFQGLIGREIKTTVRIRLSLRRCVAQCLYNVFHET